MKFDVIVGNPPYNNPKKDGDKQMNGDCLWDKFVIKSIDGLLKNEAYLCFVHPSGWRKPGELWKKLTVDNQIHYLEIHKADEGQKIFKCGTRYDWYILEKKPSYKNTIVRDELGNIGNIDLKRWDWFPHRLIPESILFDSGPKCNVIRDIDYRADKPWVSREKSDEFQYPVALSFKNDSKRLIYSSKKLSHFGVPKIICNSNGGVGGLYPYNDWEGEYGMNPLCFGISISSKEEGDEIVKALNTKKFKDFVSSILWSGFLIHHKVFECLKKDFWKQFVDANGNVI